MMSSRFCILCGQSKSVDPDIRLHSVPKDENERKQWMDVLQKFLPVSALICTNHFAPNDIGKKKLLKGAVPALTKTSPVLPLTSVPGKTCESLSVSPDPTPQHVMNFENSQPEFDTSLFFSIKNDDSLIDLPNDWSIHKLENHIVFSKVSLQETGMPYLERSVVLTSATVEAFAKNKSITITNSFISIEYLENCLAEVDKKQICGGQSNICEIFISGFASKCTPCSKLTYKLKVRSEKKRKCTIAKRKKIKQQLYTRKRKEQLESIVRNVKKELVDSKKIDIFIKNLPPIQQEMIKTCVEASQCGKTGKRYTLDWIYSCILMRIKSPKLYVHIRDNNILPLPSLSTLSRYIRNIDGRFGFRKEVISLLKEKTKYMKEWEKHGCLLVDECKISKTKTFDKNTMEFIGLVDLGDYTPAKMENNLGDHALVIMFQPFAGYGLQALACFLSGGDVTGDILAKIMLECVILCENAGLFIDVITSDGATWNRKMWKHLSVENSLEPWCIHPVDESRKLRMCSDFPHLIKCLRNNLIQKKKFRIPEGWVLFSHFENLVQYEMNKIFKMAFKLTESHIHPNNGEKMNTRLAYQLFSNTTALALRAYQSKNIQIFGNVDPAITFCQRMNRLIDIMNSSKPDTGLKLDSQEYEDLNTFLIYLDLWKQSSPVENFLSESTCEGLKATISCTLDLTQYLSKLGFKYVMTSRLNQDHLEVRMLSRTEDFRENFITTKVKSHEHCNPERLMECAKPLTVFDGLTSFLSTKSDLEKVCPNLKEAIKCIHTYTRHCMNKEEKEAFRVLFNGTGKMVHELCREGSYQEEYLRHAPCMAQVAQESEICFKSYTRAMQKIQSDSPPEISISELSVDTVLRKKRRHAADEGIRNVCCAFQEYIECSNHAVRRRCGEESAEFSKKFFNKMSNTMMQLHCSNYGRRECGLMSSSTALENSVLVIMALSFFQLLVR